MNYDDPIFQAWRDSTNCYLAGMGLPPLKASGQARDSETTSEEPLDLTDARPAGPERGSPLWDRLLKPTQGKCFECGYDTEDWDADNEDWCCEDCGHELSRQQKEDHRLDDPRHQP